MSRKIDLSDPSKLTRDELLYLRDREQLHLLPGYDQRGSEDRLGNDYAAVNPGDVNTLGLFNRTDGNTDGDDASPLLEGGGVVSSSRPVAGLLTDDELLAELSRRGVLALPTPAPTVDAATGLPTAVPPDGDDDGDSDDDGDGGDGDDEGDQYSSMVKRELKDELRRRGMEVGGNVDELRDRLRANDAESE